MLKQTLFQIGFGLAFLFCGLGMFAIFGTVTDLTCTRPEPSQVTCHKDVSLLGMTVSEETIPRVWGADTGSTCDSDGCTYRVELRTDQGIVPLTTYYSSGLSSKEALVAEINAFIDSRERAEMRSTAGAGWWIWFFPIVFGGAGLLFAFQPLWRLLRGNLP